MTPPRRNAAAAVTTLLCALLLAAAPARAHARRALLDDLADLPQLEQQQMKAQTVSVSEAFGDEEQLDAFTAEFLRTPAEVLAAKAGAKPSEEAPIRGTIIGGGPAAAGEFPFQVALLQKPQPSGTGNDAFYAQFCGGALVGSVWVLTAAHCVDGAAASSMTILVGATNLDSTSGKRYSVARIFKKPDYDSSTTANDLALIQLGSAPPSSIPRLELGRVGPAGTPLTVIGWGSTDGNGQTYPRALQKVTVGVVDFNTCNGPSSYNKALLPGMFCAGLMRGGKDSCYGDSGGPILQAKSGGGWRTVGIVSWGEGCAKANYPGIYTNIGTYASWISSTTGGAVTVAP